MTGCSVVTSEEERELHGAGEDRTLGGGVSLSLAPPDTPRIPERAERCALQ